MKGIAILAATAAMLAGCSVGAGTNMSANAASGNNAAPKPADSAAANQAGPQTADAGKLNAGGGAVPATSSGAVTLDRTFMLGRWTDDNDCSKAVEFSQDGGFTDSGGHTGLWNLEGDRLTMTGQSTGSLRVVAIDQNTITVVHADGSLGRSTRC